MQMHTQLEPPPQTFLEPLTKLRDYYARLVKEYEHLFHTAQAQLAHVEGLLSSWSLEKNHESQTIEKNDDLTEIALLANNESSFVSQSNVVANEPEVQDLEGFEEDNSLSLETESAPIQKPDTPVLEQKPLQNNAVLEQKPLQSNDSSKVLDIPLLPEYQVLTRMQAIEKLLQEHVGSVCHIDFIVRSLYGDLEPNIFRVVKGRVHSTLTHGKEKSHWAAIPDEPGCYTLDLSLVATKNGKVKSKNVAQKRKPFILPKTKRIPMLSEFEGQFLIDAISSLLKQNQGKIFSVAEIITGLYGELDSQQLRQIKSAVLNELSRGYRIGRFSRVPDKVGYYTWDVKLTIEGGKSKTLG
ncbi:hypothetical protein [Iningainema tapete]|uniref:Uncharacterized protein n=1 Tax=Iningainema tapete BLCC-T55 TaxID=2748662 RepID=A0A8J6XPG9_9CYAN|nr:hypothetical protein [Iningainema tapete]MBD2771088.1 hypothetical protein [Iningainema tapete BLCC-T55]